MPNDALNLPPLLTAHMAVEEPPVAMACRLAASGQLGAGDLVWQGTRERAEASLVLEPDVSPGRARQMALVAMVAAGDAIGALVPPEVAVTWDWPGSLRANDGEVGAITLALSEEIDETGAPRWLVVALELTLGPPQGAGEPGHAPERTSLQDEGCGTIEASALVGAWARHLLGWIDTWQSQGLAPVSAAWMFRARERGQTVMVAREGRMCRGRVVGLDDDGALTLETAEGALVLPLQARGAG